MVVCSINIPLLLVSDPSHPPILPSTALKSLFYNMPLQPGIVRQDLAIYVGARRGNLLSHESKSQ
jgi:hypothetical protein